MPLQATYPLQKYLTGLKTPRGAFKGPSFDIPPVPSRMEQIATNQGWFYEDDDRAFHARCPIQDHEIRVEPGKGMWTNAELDTAMVEAFNAHVLTCPPIERDETGLGQE